MGLVFPQTSGQAEITGKHDPKASKQTASPSCTCGRRPRPEPPLDSEMRLHRQSPTNWVSCKVQFYLPLEDKMFKLQCFEVFKILLKYAYNKHQPLDSSPSLWARAT